MLMFIDIKSRKFYFFFFLTVVFFVLTLSIISSAQQRIAETFDKEVAQHDKSKGSSNISFVELSIANHINQFQSCGFGRDDIKVKKSNSRSSSIIVYVINDSSINLKCLISKKSKITKELYDNNLIFFQSLHDDNSIIKYPHPNPDNRKIYSLEEGLIKFDDRFIVFTAPGSEGGVVGITKFSSDSVLVKVAHPLHKEDYLVSLPALELKLDKVKLSGVKAIARINKGSKKKPTDLIVQEGEFNAFKQKSAREIADLRTAIASLRNQLVDLKSGQTSSTQPKTLPNSTEKLLGLASPASSEQKNKNVSNFDKTANKKGIVQSSRPIDSEINIEDYILVITKTRSLNVRQKASTLSPVIASLQNGSKVPFEGITSSDTENINGLWYQVEYAKGKFGWISSDYSRKIKKSKNKPTPSQVAKLESNKLVPVEDLKSVAKTNKKNFQSSLRSTEIVEKSVVEVDSSPVGTKDFFKRPFPLSTDINSADIVVFNLYKWIKSWENRNTSLYLSFYSKDFKDPKRSRSQWEAYRRKSLKMALNISIQVWDIKTSLPKNNTIKVTFIQRFKSDNFSDVGLKELVWKKEPKEWKIIQESWKPEPDITQM